MFSLKKITHHPFLIRLFNWEYWPFNVVYGPLYFYWIWLFIRARSFFFFNASNPSIKNGGFLLESKKEIYDLLPQKFYPKTLFFENTADPEQIKQQLEERKFVYPLIGKPDIGMRGLGVKKLENLQEVFTYASQSRVSFLLQEYIPYENEVGIFYYRYPSATQGHISGIVGKEFLTVRGDGLLTVEELLKQDKRYILQIDTLKTTLGADFNRIPAAGEKLLLVPYGNHCRGAKFLDLTGLVDVELTLTIDRICKTIPDFYFGRMDIKYDNWEDLKQGRHFSIIELNGAGSEPTHMYDPRHSLFFAWKEIIRHWNILLRISMQNHRSGRINYMSFQSGLKMFRENGEYVKMIQPQKQIPA